MSTQSQAISTATTVKLNPHLSFPPPVSNIHGRYVNRSMPRKTKNPRPVRPDRKLICNKRRKTSEKLGTIPAPDPYTITSYCATRSNGTGAMTLRHPLPFPLPFTLSYIPGQLLRANTLIHFACTVSIVPVRCAIFVHHLKIPLLPKYPKVAMPNANTMFMHCMNVNTRTHCIGILLR